MNFNARHWSSPPQSECPVGTIIGWLGDTSSISFLISEYWFLANGASLSKIQYPELFNVIGTKYGGSGNNFSLPNLLGTTTNWKYFISLCSNERATPINNPSIPEIWGYTVGNGIFGDLYADRKKDGSHYYHSNGCIQEDWKVPGPGGSDQININSGTSRTRMGFSISANRCNGIFTLDGNSQSNVVPRSINAYPLIKVL